ncbi:hypothetical protein Lal_00002917, partial [Lupinus albus]
TDETDVKVTATIACCAIYSDTTTGVDIISQSTPTRQYSQQSYFNGQFAQGWRDNQNQNQNYNWRAESGPSNRQPPYQQPFQQSQHPPMHERQTKLEDTLEKFMQASMTNQKNTEASIRNLETQVGQLAKQMAEQHADSRQFSANTQTNPKEHCKAITTRSGKVISPDLSKNLVVEEEVLNGKRLRMMLWVFGENKDVEIVNNEQKQICHN